MGRLHRKNGHRHIFVFFTSLNFFLQYKIQFSKEVRTSWREVYVKAFSWKDIPVAMLLFILTAVITKLFLDKAVPKICHLFEKFGAINGMKYSYKKSYIFILAVWFFFLLVFYPGTAMNDTIYILESPFELSNQHPILYNLYTYGFYKIACILGNPNLSLFFISLVQMAAMDYVLNEAVSLAHRKGFSDALCVLFSIYFAFAPIFFTYAFSAIKDTPFAICLFYFMILLIQLKDSHAQCFRNTKYRIKLAVSIFGMISFRNNGIVIILGTCMVILIGYRKKLSELKCRRYLFSIFLGVIFVQKIIGMVLTPNDVEPLFQEKIGIPLQQVAAVVVKNDNSEKLSPGQEAYLYRLLPKEEWYHNYAPGCSDTLKWHDEFDREYLNQTKLEFIKIWLELGIENPKEYTEAYLLATYGIWGIETRNKEQYYIKEIWENDLGLVQKSPLPQLIKTIFYTYYCNKVTYRYLSMGTAIWVLFALTLWFLKNKRYGEIMVVSPVWFLVASLFLATPISFTFRYGFVLGMAFPFYLVLPFVMKNNGTEVRYA